MQVEIETKLLCDDDFLLEEMLALIARHVQPGEPETVRQQDTYLDTRAGCLAAAGLAARCRSKRGKRSLDIKPVPLIPEIVMRRAEISEDLPRGTEAGLGLKRMVERQFPLKLRGVPIETLTLRNRRELWKLRGRGFTAELCLDAVEARRPGLRQVARFQEVELELVDGSETRFLELAGALADLPTLLPSGMSKRERALDLLGAPTSKPRAEKIELSLVESADAAARRLCLAQLDLAQAYAAGTRVGLDPEQLHKMRVSVRRLRSAMSVFPECFTGRDGEFLNRNLKWLADVLGDVRDLDVLLLDLQEWEKTAAAGDGAAYGKLGEVARARWEAARERLLAAFATTRYERLLERARQVFSTVPRRSRGHLGRQPVGLAASEILRRQARKLGRSIERCKKTGKTEDVHRLRIAGKKLRYATEFFRSLLPRSFRKHLQKLTIFQDELGRFNDAVVQEEFIDRLAGEALETEADRDYVLTLGRLSGSLGAHASDSQRRVGEILETLQVRALRKELLREAERLARATAREMSHKEPAAQRTGEGS